MHVEDKFKQPLHINMRELEGFASDEREFIQRVCVCIVGWGRSQKLLKATPLMSKLGIVAHTICD